MEKRDFTTGSIVHVVKRGARDMPIVFDDGDRWRFIEILYYFNDTYSTRTWKQDIKNTDFLERPAHWPARDPLVDVLCYCLHENHFHLLLKELREGGIAQFMNRVSVSMTKLNNEKYGGSGSIFQSRYKSFTVRNDRHLLHLPIYIMVKNVFELHPKGLQYAINNFEEAWGWAVEYPFSSLPDFAGSRTSPILNKDVLVNELNIKNKLKKEARVWAENKKPILQDVKINHLE